MKNLKTYLILFLTAFKCIAQNDSVSFGFMKYVPYDGPPIIVNSSHSSYPDFGYRGNMDTYNQNDASLIMYIKYGKCSRKQKKPFMFDEGVSFDKQSIQDAAYTLQDYFVKNLSLTPHALTDRLNILLSMGFNISQQDWDDNQFVGYSTFNWATLVTGIETIGINKTNLFHILQALEFPQKTWILFSYNHIKNKSHSL
jgi:hypothetical protein